MNMLFNIISFFKKNITPFAVFTSVACWKMPLCLLWSSLQCNMFVANIFILGPANLHSVLETEFIFLKNVLSHSKVECGMSRLVGKPRGEGSECMFMMGWLS